MFIGFAAYKLISCDKCKEKYLKDCKEIILKKPKNEVQAKWILWCKNYLKAYGD